MRLLNILRTLLNKAAFLKRPIDVPLEKRLWAEITIKLSDKKKLASGRSKASKKVIY